MYSPIKKRHANLSGSVLPENTVTPAAQGNPTEKTTSPNDLRDASSLSLTLDNLQALLTRNEQRCQTLGLLPSGYYGEEIDFQEFFKPEAVLARATNDPSWGCLDDVAGSSMTAHQADAVRATVAELHRAFDHQQPLSARLRMRILVACREELALLYTELFATAGKAVA